MLTQRAVRKYTTLPQAEMSGHVMLSIFDNLNDPSINRTIERILRRFGLRDIDTEDWYPVQIVLDIYRELAKSGWGKFDLVNLGTQMVENTHVPAHIDTIPRAMEMLRSDYAIDIRNMPEDEGYEIEYLSDRHLLVHDRTPYPHDVVYGTILGFAERFCPADGDLTIHRSYNLPGDRDSDGAVYDISW